jgi:phosphopantetheinyl transferase (holo-ACP synthase)
VIIGLGVDVCPIERMAQILTRHGDTFVKRVFTDAEIAYAGTKLVQAERLLDQWTEAYIRVLAPRLRLGRYQGDLSGILASSERLPCTTSSCDSGITKFSVKA